MCIRNPYKVFPAGVIITPLDPLLHQYFKAVKCSSNNSEGLHTLNAIEWDLFSVGTVVSPVWNNVCASESLEALLQLLDCGSIKE